MKNNTKGKRPSSHATRGLAVFVLCVISASCTEKATDTRTTRTSNAGPEAQTGEADKEKFAFYSPSLAKASIEKKIQVGQDPTIENYDAPILKLTFTGADYAEILRCPASYKLTSLGGTEVKPEQLVGMGERLARAVWDTAFMDDNKCKIVGTQITETQYLDLPAPTGEWYYVVNPCVSKERSINRQAGCSYQLAVSDPFKHTSDFSKVALEKLQDISAAEGALNAAIADVKILAQKIELHLRACEDMVAHDKALANFKMGMLQLAGLAVGATVGFVISGGSPNAAVMLGSLTSQLGTHYLNEKVLHMLSGEQIQNECINPNVVPTTAEERASAHWTHQYAGKYEAEFGVQALIRQLRQRIDKDIPQEEDRLKTALAAMEALDQRVLTWDQAIARAANKGLDLKDPSQTVADPSTAEILKSLMGGGGQ